MLLRIMRNTLAGYLLKMLQMLIGIIAIPVFVTHVGAEGYGLILLAGTLLGYFAFFDLGMSDAITKYVAQYEALGQRTDIDQVIGTSLAVFLAIGAALSLLVLTAVQLGAVSWFNVPDALQDQAKLIFTLAAVLSLFAWPRLALQGALRGLQDFVSLNIVLGLGRLFAVGLAMILAVADQPLWAVFMAYQVDIFISLAILPLLLRQRLPGWWPRLYHVRWSILILIWSFSMWLMLSKLAVLLEYQLDTIILGVFLPLSAITAYTILTYPFRMIQQFSGLAAAAILPAVSALNSNGEQAALEAFRIKGARLHNTFLALTTVLALLLLEPFVTLWVGEEYLDYIWIAYLACAFQFIWQSNAFLGQVYTGMGLARKPGIVAIITGFTNLFLSLILVQSFGLAGVILGTVLGGLIGVAIFVVWCLPDIGISPATYLRSIFLRGQCHIWFTGLLLYALQAFVGITVDSWLELSTAVVSLFILLGIIAYSLALEPEERLALRRLFGRR